MKKAVSPVYRRLQRHLNERPVGYPRTFSGVELEILEALFSLEEAEIALGMDEFFRTASEIAERLNDDAGAVKARLEAMAAKGAVLFRESARGYALFPLVVGMYEFQMHRMDRPFVENILKYAMEGYGLEYLTTPQRQSRIIPLEKSIATGTRIPRYEELESLIREAGGRLALLDCVCRRAMDLLDKPCAYTDRRELCLSLGDYADTVIRQGWGRSISEEEALEVSRLNQVEGLVLQAANVQYPEFICGCCGDCCGLLGMLKFLPRPGDFVSSPHYCVMDTEACISCGICLKKCPMDAFVKKEGKVVLQPERCIGCGVCVTFCPRGALTLAEKEERPTPHLTTDELWADIKQRKRSPLKRLLIGVKAILGLKNRGI